jgi:NitT/TauT family transport system ATP-binding protein
LAQCGNEPDTDVDIVTIAPPFAADALANAEVDGICVSEPWRCRGDSGVGRMFWSRRKFGGAASKVLAMPVMKNSDDDRDKIERLVRALHFAGKHFIDPENWDANAAIPHAENIWMARRS